MMKQALAAIAAFSLASACAAPIYVSPVEVTRFVGDRPTELGTGTIAIAPASGTDESFEFAPYANAVIQQLEALGYRVVSGPADQQARIGLQQVIVPGDAPRSPVSVGGGASVGSYGSGMGLGIGIDLTPPTPDRVQTVLSVAIAPASGGANLWEGRASMGASINSDMADDEAAAPRIAAALFAGFPGTSAETITVE